ncbi:FAD-dependent oxidoreductase [Geobacter sp.]|uniref:FAD-dependent oxidoreductase n=1 Tax=Geobacter sp. TaxID=46610 RepID=UPI001AD25B72|nr:FAD-dependent oxidoreductase [Geobacter sp.]CAG0948180.1 formate dehydrogenase (NADP+) beta subunit [Geobacteraceae bacterium]
MKNLKGKYQVKILEIEDYQALMACQSACPLGTDTKRYVKAITDGDYEKAFLIARQTNPLVSVCSRVCTAPCEKSCRKKDEGSPVDIRALKRFACDRHGVASPHAVAKRLDELSQQAEWVGDRTGNHILTMSRQFRKVKEARESSRKAAARVAIVGSGPTGLSAAHDLALLGYRVTIFEAASLPGGMLRTGIPGFRLPKEILQQEIDAILELGVELKLNSPIGRDQSLADLRAQGYEAVFITIGLQDPLRILDMEGTDLKGIYSGVDYVRDYEKISLGKRCLVIGGGGVAIDCAQHAVRQGAGQVMIACLESWETMPASLSEKEDAQEEGIVFHPSLGPRRFLGHEGRVTRVEFLKVSSVFDAEGKFSPTFVPNSTTILEVDSVILAVGQASTAPSLSGLEGLEMTPNGLIRAAEDMSTNLPGVFVGGDVRWRFTRNATDAIADGQKAARAIHGYLGGKTLEVRKKGYMRALAPDFENTRCETIAPIKIPKRAASERIRTKEEITLGYDEAQARQQAARCRQCSIQAVFDRSRCLLCGTCAETCVNGALRLVRVADIQGDEKVAKLTDALEKASPRTRGMTAIIKDESRCVSCGMCARRCPGGAITMAEFYSQEEWE